RRLDHVARRPGASRRRRPGGARHARGRSRVLCLARAAAGACAERRGTTAMSSERRTPNRRFLTLALVLSLLSSIAQADGIAWPELTEAQRQVLAGQAQDWAQLPPDRQEQLARVAERWLDISLPQRRQLRETLLHWRALDEDER